MVRSPSFQFLLPPVTVGRREPPVKHCPTPQSTLSTPKHSSPCLQGWQRWGSPPEVYHGFPTLQPYTIPLALLESSAGSSAAVSLGWMLPTLLCDAWEEAASRPCSSSSCSSSSCSSVGSKLYMGMSWCRSFSNLPRGGKGLVRRTGLRLLPTPLLRLSAACFYCCTGILLLWLLLDGAENLLHTAGRSARHPECSYRD